MTDTDLESESVTSSTVKVGGTSIGSASWTPLWPISNPPSAFIRKSPTFSLTVILTLALAVVTERHYSPWVRSRHEQLEQDLRRVLEQDPVALMQTKATPEVHEKTERPN